jgi:hypothetical protein
MQQPQRRFSKAWNEEFESQKEMQEDRLHHFANMTCQDRCVQHYMTNSLVLNERSCFERCIKKHSQAGVVTNLNYARFEQVMAKRGAGKK